MTDFLDTAETNAPVTETGDVYYFGPEVKFFISIASNLIAGQSTGPTVRFSIFSQKQGIRNIDVTYGTTNTNYAVQQTGYKVTATVLSGTGSVNCRVVIKDQAFPISVTTIGVAPTATGNVTLAHLINQAVTAGVKIFGALSMAGPTPLNAPCILRVQVSFDHSGILTVFPTAFGGLTLNGAATPQALLAGAVYAFDILSSQAGFQYDFEYSVNAQLLDMLVVEIDNQTA